jgi:hypothetical protein
MDSAMLLLDEAPSIVSLGLNERSLPPWSVLSIVQHCISVSGQ